MRNRNIAVYEVKERVGYRLSDSFINKYEDFG